jgi:virulence-associated protein VapD
MEAIRFRMYAVDRGIHAAGDPASLRQAFEDVRQALEAAGFHTRSHSAP